MGATLCSRSDLKTKWNETCRVTHILAINFPYQSDHISNNQSIYSVTLCEEYQLGIPGITFIRANTKDNEVKYCSMAVEAGVVDERVAHLTFMK